MARWQRDPESRRRLGYLLVGVEVLALVACTYGVSQAYALRGMLLVGASGSTAKATAWIVGLVLTVAVLGLGVWMGRKYMAGRRWPRAVFILANVALVGLGLVWFIVHQARHGAGSDNAAALLGLLLPVVTLFPLLWPLLRFRPLPEGEADGGP